MVSTRVVEIQEQLRDSSIKVTNKPQGDWKSESYEAAERKYD
jgi:hypothetical protein